MTLQPATRTPNRGDQKRSPQSTPRQVQGAGGSASTPPRKPPKYRKGDYVVHIHHGVAHISDIQTLKHFGEEDKYYVLDFPAEEMVVSIPTNKALYTLRPLISKAQTTQLVDKLKSKPQEQEPNWSRWYKVLQEKMQSGDVFQVAEVVRDLNYANQTKGISPALKKMINRAREALVTEIQYSMDLDIKTAKSTIGRALPTFEAISRKQRRRG